MSARKTTSSAPGTWDAMLRAVLLPNRLARIVREEPDGTIALAVPTRKPPALQRAFSWLVRVPKERITVLDPIGSEIWRACDGKRSVEAIVENFAKRHHLSFHESRVSVTSYSTSLVRRGVLAVAVEPSE
jgi:hypothetical protein